MLPGGRFLSSNFEMACAQKCQAENEMFLIGYKYERFLINCQRFRKNGTY